MSNYLINTFVDTVIISLIIVSIILLIKAATIKNDNELY